MASMLLSRPTLALGSVHMGPTAAKLPSGCPSPIASWSCSTTSPKASRLGSRDATELTKASRPYLNSSTLLLCLGRSRVCRLVSGRTRRNRATVTRAQYDGKAPSSLTEREERYTENAVSASELDRQDIQNILQVVELLRTKRDMTFNEVRLTVMIEDPRDVERRRMLNIEDDRGCSREEMGNALLEVYEGRVPEDRITLRELAKEMLNWPNLEDEIAAQERLPPVASPYAKVTDTGVDPRLAAERAKVDWDSASDIMPGEEKKDISEVLPPAVGFSFLYLISALPVIIGITVVVILFLNSLQ